jgi:hypothetical protein
MCSSAFSMPLDRARIVTSLSTGMISVPGLLTLKYLSWACRRAVSLNDFPVCSLMARSPALGSLDLGAALLDEPAPDIARSASAIELEGCPPRLRPPPPLAADRPLGRALEGPARRGAPPPPSFLPPPPPPPPLAHRPPSSRGWSSSQSWRSRRMSRALYRVASLSSTVSRRVLRSSMIASRRICSDMALTIAFIPWEGLRRRSQAVRRRGG